MISLTGRGNIKAAATTARRHKRRRWLSNCQAPTPRVTTRPPRRQFICLSGIIYSNHSELIRYRYNAGINRPPPSPPLSSRTPIAGEFKCLQRPEHHGSHLDSTYVHRGIGNWFAISKWTGRRHCGLVGTRGTEGCRVDNPRHLGWQQGHRGHSS